MIKSYSNPVHSTSAMMLQKRPVALFKSTSVSDHIWKNIISTLRIWAQRTRQRRQLMELDDQHLKDIGVSRVDALQEYHKPFWRE